MTRRNTLLFRSALLGSALLATGAAVAEQELFKDEARGTKLEFSADVLGAWYQSNDSWFGESASFLGANTDKWADIGIEPALSFETGLGKGTFFGLVSGVYTSTTGDDASGLTVGLDDTSEMTLEQGNVGWKVEDLFERMAGDTVSITIGRQDYSIGTGLLINDGGGDGGERGGWYLGMRKAFSDSLIARLDTDKWLVEGFTLKNQPRQGGTQGEAYGANVEYKIGEDTRFGGTYMQVDSNVPGSAKLDVASGRVNWRAGNGFGVSGEYVDESSSQITATGYYGEVSYASKGNWSPVFSLRYAHFDGDNPATPQDERFREIAYGYTDWGTWYQGEITGEYALGNGNVVSQMFRAKMNPTEDVTLNFMFYNFTLDQPASFGVTSKNWGDEVNVTVDWAVNDRVLVTGVLGMLMPGDAATQYTGGTSDWIHSMLYVMYSW